MFEPCECDNCSACRRVDTDRWDGDKSIITYVGDYVVATSVADEHSGILAALGIVDESCPKYTTVVGYVGPWSLAESEEHVEVNDFHRFIQRHDAPLNVHTAHDMIVEGVRNMMIDVSCPLTSDEYEEQMEY